jgi:hypothetical protein
MPDPGVFQKAYRVFSWASLLALIVVIILVLRKSPPPAVPYDPTAAKRVEQKFAAADQAKGSGRPAQVQIDPTELNSYLSQNLQLEGSAPTSAAPNSVPAPAASMTPGTSSPAPGGSAANDAMAALASSDPQTIAQVQSSVKDVKVDMDGDLVKAYVIFDFHGKDLSLELDGHLGTQNGYVQFQPVAGKLGSLPLPQSTLDAAVAKMMSSPENRDKLKLPDDISDIQIVDGKAVLSYK